MNHEVCTDIPLIPEETTDWASLLRRNSDGNVMVSLRDLGENNNIYDTKDANDILEVKLCPEWSLPDVNVTFWKLRISFTLNCQLEI